MAITVSPALSVSSFFHNITIVDDIAVLACKRCKVAISSSSADSIKLHLKACPTADDGLASSLADNIDDLSIALTQQLKVLPRHSNTVKVLSQKLQDRLWQGTPPPPVEALLPEEYRLCCCFPKDHRVPEGTIEDTFSQQAPTRVVGQGHRCRFVSHDVAKMRVHLVKDHVGETLGGKVPAAPSLQEQGFFVLRPTQFFFVNGGRGKYFEVGEREVPTDTQPILARLQEQSLKAQTALRGRTSQLLDGLNIDSRLEPCSWLYKSRFRDFERQCGLEPGQRQALCHLASGPSGRVGIRAAECSDVDAGDLKPQLEVLERAVRYLIRDCRRIVQPDTGPSPQVVLQFLSNNCGRISEKKKVVAFGKITEATEEAYTDIAVRLACFAIRCWLVRVGRQEGPKLPCAYPDNPHQYDGHGDTYRPRYAPFERCSTARCASDVWSMLNNLDQGSSKKTPSAQLKDAVARLFLSLFEQQLWDDEFQSVLVCFCAVIAMQPGLSTSGDTGYRRPDNYSKSLSAVIYTSKYIFLWAGNHELSTATTEAGNTTTLHLSDFVNDHASYWMDRPDNKTFRTPLSVVHQLRNIAIQASYDAASTIHVEVSTDLQTASVQGQIITVQGLYSAINSMIVELSSVLETQLLFLCGPEDKQRHPLPTLPSSSGVADDASDARPGQSWANTDPALHRGRLWLNLRIASDSELSRKLLQPANPTRDGPVQLMRPDAFLRYVNAARRFLLKLMGVMLLTGGQPCRVTELLTIRHTNTVFGGLRTILRSLEGWYYAPQLTKDYLHTGHTHVNYHLLPQEVGDVLCRYLWHVQPFIDEMGILVNPNAFTPSPFLAGVEQMKTCLKSQELPGDDDSTDADAASDDSEGDEDDIGEYECAQLSQGEAEDAVGIRINARDFYRSFEKEFDSHLGTKLNVRQWRHLCKALVREIVDDDPSTRPVNSPTTTAMMAALHSQSNHSSAVANTHYGTSSGGSFNHVTDRKLQFKWSMLWWVAIGVPSALERVSAARMPFGLSLSMEPLSVWLRCAMKRAEWQYMRMAALPFEDPSRLFRRLTGNPDAQLRQTQQDALKYIMRRDTRLLAVMPTGSGKTILFALPILSQCTEPPSSQTIVIVPFLALQEDLVARFRSWSIVAEAWSPDTKGTADIASVLVVTPESLSSPPFQQYIRQQLLYSRVDRVVVDECHHILVASSTLWRPDYLNILRLFQQVPSMIFLTATLAPRNLNRFLSLVEPFAGPLTILRSPSVRPEIRLSVFQAPVLATHKPSGQGGRLGRIASSLDTVLARLRAYHGDSATMVVFSTLSRQQNMDLSATTKLPLYMSGSERTSAEQVAQMQASKQRWMDGEIPCIIATSSISEGVHNTHLVAVVHVGPVYSLEELAQKDGRVARAGQQGDSVVIDTKEGAKCPYVDRYISTQGCRRVALEAYMDGPSDRTRCHAYEVSCDNCDADVNDGVIAPSEQSLPAMSSQPGPVDDCAGGFFPPSAMPDTIPDSFGDTPITSPAPPRPRNRMLWQKRSGGPSRDAHEGYVMVEDYPYLVSSSSDASQRPAETPSHAPRPDRSSHTEFSDISDIVLQLPSAPTPRASTSTLGRAASSAAVARFLPRRTQMGLTQLFNTSTPAQALQPSGSGPPSYQPQAHPAVTSHSSSTVYSTFPPISQTPPPPKPGATVGFVQAGAVTPGSPVAPTPSQRHRKRRSPDADADVGAYSASPSTPAGDGWRHARFQSHMAARSASQVTRDRNDAMERVGSLVSGWARKPCCPSCYVAHASQEVGSRPEGCACKVGYSTGRGCLDCACLPTHQKAQIERLRASFRRYDVPAGLCCYTCHLPFITCMETGKEIRRSQTPEQTPERGSRACKCPSMLYIWSTLVVLFPQEWNGLLRENLTHIFGPDGLDVFTEEERSDDIWTTIHDCHSGTFLQWWYSAIPRTADSRLGMDEATAYVLRSSSPRNHSYIGMLVLARFLQSVGVTEAHWVLA